MPSNNIKRWRILQGLTQSELADLVGCRRETISNLECGRYNASWSLVYRLCQILLVCPCHLMASVPNLCDWEVAFPNNNNIREDKEVVVSTNDAIRLRKMGYKGGDYHAETEE